MPDDSATAQNTAIALLERSGRTKQAVPLRRELLQRRELGVPVPGPFAALVTARDRIAVQLYVLAMAVATAPPYAVRRHASLWARAIGLEATPGTAATISRAWRRLERHNLVKREHWHQRVQITPLREDGLGAPYVPPGSQDAAEPYFTVPFEFWTAPAAWYLKLTLAEIAVLFIGLSLSDDFLLPSTKAPMWYGISRATAERGLRGLQERGLLDRRIERWAAPLSARGHITQSRYTLRPPFGPRGRSTSTGRQGDGSPVREQEVSFSS